MNNSKYINIAVDSVCAVIPFFNEKKTLNLVLDETLHYVKFVFAVNDGSNDDSYLEERNKINVNFIDLEKNYGKGNALRIGFESAVSSGFDSVVTLDADLQHDPKYIPELVKELSTFDIVIGNRLKNIKEMPLQRRFSNKITSFLLTLKTGQEILDSQCGFRAFRAEALKELKIKYSGFEAESEILIKAAKKGYKIGFVDIPTIYGNEKSKMKPLQAILGFTKILFSN